MRIIYLFIAIMLNEICRVRNVISTNNRSVMKQLLIAGMMLMACIFNDAKAQGWEKLLGSNASAGHYVEQTADGGYIIAGVDTTDPNSGINALLIKTDQFGDEQWSRLYEGMDWGSYVQRGYVVHQTSDGGYILGTRYYNNNVPNYGTLLIKTDAIGDTLWTSWLDPGGYGYFRDLEQTSDGGYIVTGMAEFGPNRDAYVLKTDAQGQQQWIKYYDQSNTDNGSSIDQTSDGGYVFGGNAIFGNEQAMWVVKTDAVGDTLWTKKFGFFDGNGHTSIIRCVQQTADDGYIVSGEMQGRSCYFKLNAQGDSLWGKQLFNNSYAEHIIETSTGDYLLSGAKYVNFDLEFMLAKIEAQGDTLWTKTYTVGQSGDEKLGLCGRETTDGGYIAVGYWAGWSFWPARSRVYLIKTDAAGNTTTMQIKGNVYQDMNQNCVQDIGDQGIQQYVVEATGPYNYIEFTDANGDYAMDIIDTGQYTVRVYNQTYWDSANCSYNSFSTHLGAYYDTVTVDFARAASLDCELMTVDVSTPILRRCFDNVYTVTYCNTGTEDALNAYVEVEFDDDFQVNSSDIPWNTPQVGNLYVFDLGTVPYNSCGSFEIHTTLDPNCDTTVIGQTHCVAAHIYPDSSCFPVDPNWDGASIRVDAECINGDSILFTIENVGTGDMIGPLNYYVVEDNIMLYNNTYQLNSGQLFQFYQPTHGGATYRLTAEQSPGHPWSDDPVTVFIEGCTSQSTFNLGFVTPFSNSDEEPFLSIDCQENIGSYDPNDKRVFPAGYGPSHYITVDDRLNYHIRFQNTGTDTAFTVVILDTLSPYVNITTLVPGTSSHPYVMDVVGNNVLRFTFNNILLPDSFVNEPASHGFVKFSIEQQPNNPLGTVIENSAAIYFDFNEPVITNTAFSTIGEDFIEVSVDERWKDRLTIEVYPNPFVERAMFNLSEQFEDLNFEVYNLMGAQVRTQHFDRVKQFEFYREGLPAGVYLFQLSSDGQLVGTGKIVLR